MVFARDAVGDVAGHQEVLPGDDVRPQRAAEQERCAGEFWLTPIGKPLWSVDDRRDRPAAEQRVADAARAGTLAFAERQHAASAR